MGGASKTNSMGCSTTPQARPDTAREQAIAFICRHVAPAVLPVAHVASVRPWSAVPHIVDTAVGHDAETHDNDVGTEGSTAAPQVRGRWSCTAKMERERVGLSAHLRMKRHRAQRAAARRGRSSWHSSLRCSEQCRSSSKLWTPRDWSGSRSGYAPIAISLLHCSRRHQQNTRFASRTACRAPTDLAGAAPAQELIHYSLKDGARAKSSGPSPNHQLCD
jgi:hypothetical protein